MPTFKRAQEKEETILLLLAIFREGLGPAAAETSVSTSGLRISLKSVPLRFGSEASCKDQLELLSVRTQAKGPEEKKEKKRTLICLAGRIFPSTKKL